MKYNCSSRQEKYWKGNEANNSGVWPLERQDCAWVLKDWDKQASDLDWIGSVKQERWLFELNSFCLHPSISDTLHIRQVKCISQLYLWPSNLL